jgi:FdhE protein
MTDPQALSGGAALGAIPHLRLPSPPSLFGRRADRLAALAPGHTLSEFLEFLSHLAAAQAAASATVRIPLDRARLGPERPLDAAAHLRGTEWREALAVIVAELAAVPLPDESRTALELLVALPPPEIEALADRVLANAVLGADLAA